jgi:hypothetical protein
MSNGTNSQPNRSGILNVIFHGTFVFQRDEKAERITAWIPKLDPEHVYRAGSWLAETELQRGHYQLEGVETGGTGIFDPARNLILNPPPHEPDEAEIHAHLTLPWPKTVTSLRIATISRRFFRAADELVDDRESQHAAAVQVFTYDFQDDNRLKLADCTLKPSGGHYWEPVYVGNYVNLHIFSAEDHYEQPSLAIDDFGKTAGLFGFKLSLRKSLPMSGVRDNETPEGVDPKETEDLAPRTLRLALLGRLMKQGGNANLAWYGNDALDGDPGACSGFIC